MSSRRRRTAGPLIETMHDPGDEEATIEPVSKQDAAIRQLRTAIWLFFEDEDMLSVQTLVAAAHGILSCLVKLKKGRSFLKDNDLIWPEYMTEWKRILNVAPNFLKHADRDPNESLQFRPEMVQFWILDCVFMEEILTVSRLHESIVFMAWCVKGTRICLGRTL